MLNVPRIYKTSSGLRVGPFQQPAAHALLARGVGRHGLVNPLLRGALKVPTRHGLCHGRPLSAALDNNLGLRGGSDMMSGVRPGSTAAGGAMLSVGCGARDTAAGNTDLVPPCRRLTVLRRAGVEESAVRRLRVRSCAHDLSGRFRFLEFERGK